MGDFLPYENQYTRTIKNWKIFVLQFFGQDILDNQALCPKTTQLVSRIPNMTGVMFSVLNPHQHIYPHRGFVKGVLRLHIGLIVPKDPTLCTFRLDGKDVHWYEGKSFMFDQTYEHQVWNHSDEVRVVLLLDVLRPLPFPLHQLNSWVAKTAGTSFLGKKLAKVVERWTTNYPKDIKERKNRPFTSPALAHDRTTLA
jgi:beta-hydroxylase